MPKSTTTLEVIIEPEATRKRLPFPAGWYQEYHREAMRCAPLKETDNGGRDRDYSKLPSSAQMQKDFALFVERVGVNNLTDDNVRKRARKMYK
jgi:hypothetical protein